MIAEVAEKIVMLFTAGLLMYFLQEALKAGKESGQISRKNGDSLKDIMSELNNLRSEMTLVTKHLDTAMSSIEAYNKSIDTVFSINGDRHGEIMTKTEDIMREQRKVQNTVDLERARLDSFSEAGIKLADKVHKNASQVKRMDAYLIGMRKKLNDVPKKTDEE